LPGDFWSACRMNEIMGIGSRLSGGEMDLAAND